MAVKMPWEKKYTVAPVEDAPAAVDSAAPKMPWEGKYSVKTPSGKPISPALKGSILRQKADVFTSDKYSRKPEDAQANLDKFNSIGEPLTIFGVPTGIRLQNTTNAEGEPRKEILESPSVNMSDQEKNTSLGSGVIKEATDADKTLSIKDRMKNQIAEEGAYFQKHKYEILNPGTIPAIKRTIGGGILDTIKNTVDLSAFLLSTGNDGTAPDGTVVNPVNKSITDLQKSFDENFPSMPANNSLEKAGQEMISVAVGYNLGRKGVELSMKTAEKEFGPKAPQYAEWLGQQYQKFLAGGRDPAEAMARLKLLTKVLAQEVAGNAGVAAFSNEDTKGLSTSWIKELPDWSPIDKDQLDKIGIFVDNNAFSAGAAIIGKVIGLGADKLISILPKSQTAEPKVMTDLLMTLDAGINERSPKEEVARRLAILGEVATSNSKFTGEFLGENITANLDATTALMIGAKEYMSKVYADVIKNLPAAQSEKYINKRAKDFIEQLVSVKQTLKNNPTIATSDANVLESFGQTLNKTADNVAIGPLPSNRGEIPSDDSINKLTTQQKVVGAAGESFGQPIADSLNATKPQLSNVAPQAVIADTQATATLSRLLTDAKSKGLIRDTAINNIVETELPRLYNTDKAKVDQAFSTIPAVSVDPMELAQAIKAAGDQKGLMDTLRLAPGELDAVGKIANDYVDADGVTHSPVADLAKQIEEAGLNDLPTLVNKVRPLLAQLKDQVWRSPNKFNKDTGPLSSIIEFIEQNANSTGNEFGDAMDVYKGFSDKWLNTQPLKDFAEAADSLRTVKTSGNTGPIIETTRNKPLMLEKAVDAYNQSVNSQTDAYLQKFLEAIKDPEGKNHPALQQAWLAQAIDILRKKPTGQIKAADIEGAAQTVLKQLEVSGDKDTIKMFNDAIERYHLAENNMIDPKATYDGLKADYDEMMTKAKLSAAYDFVRTYSEVGTVVRDKSEMAGIFNKIFSSSDGVTTIGILLNKAKSENNQLAVDGIKSQFIKYIQGKTGVKKGVGFDVGNNINIATGDVKTVRDLSPASLAKIFEDPSDTTLPMLAKVYADDPKTGSAIVELLQVMNLFVNGRATKINPFGSNTATDSGQMSKLVNLGITFAFGVLNSTATKIRGATKLFLEGNKKAQIQAVVETILSQIVTDPNYVDNMARQLSDKMGQEQWKKDFERSLNYTLAHGGLEVAEPTKTPEDKTEEAIPTK